MSKLDKVKYLGCDQKDSWNYYENPEDLLIVGMVYEITHKFEHPENVTFLLNEFDGRFFNSDWFKEV